ncbi:protein of unknown function DUF1018 [Desulfatibacillum aliphaticivorans]|uniref:Uncharacterized protein n=1 Tax=Desulfatibacillum aliphaticivorans TaxID=218208 RepID=B8FD24_DESAL|nr:regulatory protein GemA [Desulfatibacillum aliphaticivorans]ACL06455.1 protein of unknown function DUF1018 [Desulfatibacillum aliphaticivorans]
MAKNEKKQSQEDWDRKRRLRDLAMIHIAKDYFMLPNYIYRDIIRGISNGRTLTAADLTAQERRNLIDLFKRKGWRPVHESARKSGMRHPPPMEREAMLDKIGAILADLDLPWSYADGMAKKMFKVDMLRWLDPHQTHKLLVALVYHQRRVYSKQAKVLSMKQEANNAAT